MEEQFAQPSNGNIAEFIESQNPNLPLLYWQKNTKGQKLELNGSCAKMPDPLTLHYNNIYWQEVVTSNFTLHPVIQVEGEVTRHQVLYAAYLDIRRSLWQLPF